MNRSIWKRLDPSDEGALAREVTFVVVALGLAGACVLLLQRI